MDELLLLNPAYNIKDVYPSDKQKPQILSEAIQ
jgi:hypothetical protein